MSRWSSYHVHSKYDDGKGDLREYVLAALEAGLEHLGFSNHNPVPFPTNWEMPEANLPLYLRAVRELQEEYRDRLPIFLGLEVDYLPGIRHPHSPEIRSLGLDYTIGSVHFLGRLPDGAYWTMDNNFEELRDGLRHSFEGDAPRMVREYFGRLRAMAAETPPDIIGHFDLLKLYNRGGCFFDEEGRVYREAVREALEAAAAAGCILEVNTASTYRKKLTELYPSDWILGQCRELKIPLILNADAHQPDTLTGHFPEAARRLRALGIRTQRVLTRAGWADRELPE